MSSNALARRARRHVLWTLSCIAALAVASAVSLAPASRAEGGLAVLVRLEWRDEVALQTVVALGGAIRYSSHGSAIAQIPDGAVPRFQELFPGLSVVDTLEPAAGQWLVVPNASPALDSLSGYGKLTLLGEEGVYLIAVDEGLEGRLGPFVFSMSPLPERVKVRGLLPHRMPSTLAPGAAANTVISPEKLELMRQVSSRVSVDSVRAIVHLVSVDDSTGALRSRYTFRREAAWIPHLLREKLRAAMGGGGIDSLHAFAIRIFGIDTVMYNVVGRVPGRVPGSGKFVICAHYDATGSRTAYPEPGRYWDYRVDPAPGADDNGSGIASVLECARALSGLQFDFDLEFVLFCAEEQGLFGSRAYVEENEILGTNMIGTLNFDMHGFRGSSDSTFVRTNPSSEWLSNHVSTVSDALYDSVGLRVGLVVIDGVHDASDHSSFWSSGYDAVHFFEHSWLPPLYPYYHTIYDTEDKLNFELCAKVASVGAASVAYFAETTDPWDLEVLSGDIQFRVERSALPVTRAISGEVVTIVPSFHNVGGAATESLSIYVRIYDGDPATGGALIGERLVEGEVPSGGSPVVEPFGWLLGEQDVGKHGIYIVVDAGVGEGNLSNNKAWTELVVASTSLAVRYSFVFPNPVRPEEGRGKLRFFLTKEASGVRLDLYDVSGRRVGGCEDASCGVPALKPGDENEIDLAAITSGAELAPGVYAYQLRIDEGGSGRVSFGRFAVLR